MAVPATTAGTASTTRKRRLQARRVGVVRDTATLALLILFALLPLLLRFCLLR